MQNRKGIGIVTVLAFLALALILFAGMVITFQSSAAREASEFDEQQVLLMAQSYSELINDKLTNEEELQKNLIAKANGSGNLIIDSEIKDISTTVKYDTGSLGCLTDTSEDGTATTEVCTLPVEIETTSTLSRISRKAVSRTIKNKAEITRTTVTTTAGGQFTGIGDYDDYALVTELQDKQSFEKADYMPGIGYFINKNGTRIYIRGSTKFNTNLPELAVSPLPSDSDNYETCTKNIVSSCILSKTVNENFEVNAKTSDNEKPIFIVVPDKTVLGDINVYISVGGNQSVIFYLEGKLTLNGAKIYRDSIDNSEGFVLLMSDTTSELELTSDPHYEGMVYMPKGSIRNDASSHLEFGGKASFNGVVIIGKLETVTTKNIFSIEYERQNLGNLCSGANYCPFPIPGGEGEGEGEGGGTGEPVITTTYSSGGIKYAK